MTDIQAIIVEDDKPTRIALRTALRSQPGIEVASAATNGETGLVWLASLDHGCRRCRCHLARYAPVSPKCRPSRSRPICNLQNCRF